MLVMVAFLTHFLNQGFKGTQCVGKDSMQEQVFASVNALAKLSVHELTSLLQTRVSKQKFT